MEIADVSKKPDQMSTEDVDALKLKVLGDHDQVLGGSDGPVDNPQVAHDLMKQQGASEHICHG